jgi:hypothetical protein
LAITRYPEVARVRQPTSWGRSRRRSQAPGPFSCCSPGALPVSSRLRFSG